MSVNFPNMSRSYDAAGDRIRFWGHDGTVEVSFFLEIGALRRLFPETPNIEPRILAAFDGAWDRIIAAARKVYSPRGGRNFYVLGAADLL
jgi:Protein of unknown function (DUF1488)